MATTVVRGPDQPEPGSCDPMYNTGCPGVTRSYLVGVDIAGAYDEALETLARNGFAVTETYTSGCQTGLSNSGTCSFYAIRGSDKVLVRIYAPADGGVDIDAPRSLVNVQATRL